MTKRTHTIVFFFSCDGTIKKNIWMSEPSSDMPKVAYKCYQKKRKQRLEKESKEEECHENQKEAREKGFCCYEHGKLLVEEARVKKARKGKC